MRTALSGGTLLEPVDDELFEMYQAYSYAKLFHCSLDEFEARPFKESQWMLKIDEAFNAAVNDANERSNGH